VIVKRSGVASGIDVLLTSSEGQQKVTMLASIVLKEVVLMRPYIGGGMAIDYRR